MLSACACCGEAVWLPSLVSRDVWSSKALRSESTCSSLMEGGALASDWFAGLAWAADVFRSGAASGLAASDEFAAGFFASLVEELAVGLALGAARAFLGTATLTSDSF